MSNAPFSDNLNEHDFKMFQTYVQVQAVAMTTLRKENEQLRKENDELKQEATKHRRRVHLWNLAEDFRINDQVAKEWTRWATLEDPVPEAVKQFVLTAVNHESSHMQMLIRELRARIAKLENHEYEGSERWSPENGDEVYRNGNWVPKEKSCHPDDDEQLIAEAKQYYNMDDRTWLGLSKIAQVALMQHYNKEV